VQQVQEAVVVVEQELVKEQVVEQVMQLVQEILQPGRVRAQGSVIFQPKLGPRELPPRVERDHLCGVPQQAAHRQPPP
jgi:hypothetical protein